MHQVCSFNTYFQFCTYHWSSVHWVQPLFMSFGITLNVIISKLLVYFKLTKNQLYANPNSSSAPLLMLVLKRRKGKIFVLQMDNLPFAYWRLFSSMTVAFVRKSYWCQESYFLSPYYKHGWSTNRASVSEKQGTLSKMKVFAVIFALVALTSAFKFRAKEAIFLTQAKNYTCDPDETTCPGGCCPEPNWFCCPDSTSGIHSCAATAADCERCGPDRIPCLYGGHCCEWCCCLDGCCDVTNYC